MFCTFNNDFPSAILKLLIAGTALVKLLGWAAFASGFVASVLVIPLTSRLSTHYSKIQFGMMKYRDARAHILTEALQGMRQIKFSALEGFWEDKILRSRENELAQYWKSTLAICALICVANLGPLLLEAVSISVYALSGDPGGIRASVVFTALSLFEQLNVTVAIMPLLAAYVLEAWTSCCRLETFFGLPERAVVTTPGDAVEFDDATVSWPRAPDAPQDMPVEERSMLRNVSLSFPNGKLSVVTGRTGSGKSLLLAAILSEVDLHGGKIKVPPRPSEAEEASFSGGAAGWILPSQTAFVSQSPWIEGVTVRENILFGLPFVESRYYKVLHACALEKDIELLADGDETEVGPKGVTLSGGQRWRIALARALYSRAGILVLDDVLSAVDAHVGRRIVDHVLDGELAEGRTRILATHHAELVLPRASYFVRLRDGRVEHAEMLSSPGEASTLAVVEADRTGSDDEDSQRTEVSEPPDALIAPTPMEGSIPAAQADAAVAAAVAAVDAAGADGSGNGAADGSQVQPPRKAAKKKRDDDRDEKRAIGRVDWRVYRAYWQASGGWTLWTVSALMRIATNLMHVAQNWSLKELTDMVTEKDAATVTGALVGLFVGPATTPYPTMHKLASPLVRDHRNSSGIDFLDFAYTGSVQSSLTATTLTDDATARRVKFFVGLYVLLYIAVVAGYVVQTIVSFVIGLRASRSLFQRMTHAVLRAPLRWIDTVPSGRILNRFTTDTATVDRRLAQDLGYFVSGLLSVVVILGTSLAVSRFVIFFGLVLFLLYGWIGRRYMSAARDAKRIGSVSNSPVGYSLPVPLLLSLLPLYSFLYNLFLSF